MLKIITAKAKQEIEDLDEVTPLKYKEVFNSIAIELGHDIEDICHDKLSNQCDVLEDNIDTAVEAIEHNDKETLNKVKENISLIKVELEEIRDLIFKDELTGVFNRKYLNTELVNNGEMLKSGVLVILDLNNLKQINDKINHVAGDKAIVYLAKKLFNFTKHVIRFGGDEFILFFEDTSIVEVYKQLNEFRNKLIHKSFKWHEHKFKISFAFSAILANKNDSFKALLEEVDKAMYRDKEEIKRKFKI